MKKLCLLLATILFLYGCSSKEVIVPVDVKMEIIENMEYTAQIPVNLKYIPLYEENFLFEEELPEVDYIFTLRNANVREMPSTNGKKIGRTIPNKKIACLEAVSGEEINGNKRWYKVDYNGKVGYIHSSVSRRRRFEFEEMGRKVRKLETFIKKGSEEGLSIERIVAYKPGASEDEGTPRDMYGNRGEQSTTGVFKTRDGKDGFRYLQDGRIVTVDRKKDAEEKENNMLKVRIPDSIRDYEVELGKTKKLEIGDNIKRVIVIDTKNQTEGIFWKRGEIWELVAYTLITSGLDDGKTSYETPKGYFIITNTVTEVIFPYKEIVRKELLDDEGNLIEDLRSADELGVEDFEEVQKYSRGQYGIRFSGGGYLHGIPVKDDIVKALDSEEKVKDLKKRNEITLGTFKRSHKCVRTPDKIEKFLYDEFVGFYEKDKDKRWRLPKNDVAVIVY